MSIPQLLAQLLPSDLGRSPIVFPPALDALNDGETLLALLGTIVLVLLTAIYLVWTSTSETLERTILVVGPASAGKTALFSQLTHAARPATHPSLLSSSSHMLLAPPPDMARLPPRKFKIVDCPGHARLAGGTKQLLERESKGGKKSRTAVVFVVDGSASKEKDIGGVVDALLPLLPYAAPPAPMPILLLSSKLDLLPPTSRSLAVPRLHTALTRELSARKASALQSGGKIELLEDDSAAARADGDVDEVLRRGGSKWRWEDWKGISWAGGWTVDIQDKTQEKASSVLKGLKEGKDLTGGSTEDGLGELKEWLWSLN